MEGECLAEKIGEGHDERGSGKRRGIGVGVGRRNEMK